MNFGHILISLRTREDLVILGNFSRFFCLNLQIRMSGLGVQKRLKNRISSNITNPNLSISLLIIPSAFLVPSLNIVSEIRKLIVGGVSKTSN